MPRGKKEIGPRDPVTGRKTGVNVLNKTKFNYNEFEEYMTNIEDEDL
jgi:hypothetical protein